MKVMMLFAVALAAVVSQSAPDKKATTSLGDTSEPFFEPPVIDVEGTPAEGLFNYNFWRIMSDSEKTNGVGRLCKVWKDATSCQVVPDDCDSKMTVTQLKDGRYFVDWTFVVKTDALPPIPRVGLSFPLKGTFTSVRWNGRGPWENYPARRNNAKLGVYAADMSLVAESRPNFGYRSACRWMEVSEPIGRGMRIEAVSAPFGFSIRPHADAHEGFMVNIDAYVSSEISPAQADAQSSKRFRLAFLVSEL